MHVANVTLDVGLIVAAVRAVVALVDVGARRSLASQLHVAA